MVDFFYSLFDWNMRQMITPRVIRLFYIIICIIYVIAGIGALVWIITLGEPALAVLSVFAIPLVLLIPIIATRILLEAIVIRFRQYEMLDVICYELIHGAEQIKKG